MNQKYDVEYNLDLDKKVDNGVQKYTINGKTFSELDSLKIKSGDTVKLVLKNKGKVDHPMHLHGHFFQVIGKNGKVISGKLMKDTLLIKPGEEYVIAFKADNSGNWVIHCHELHHAASGMMQKIEYTDFKSNYSASPINNINKPE